jgi:4-alpha-glucanotransferase
VIEPALAELAGRWGVQTGYWDTAGHWHDTSVEALVAVLVELGAAISAASDAPQAIVDHDRLLGRTPIEPVFTVASGTTLGFELRLPTGAGGDVHVTVATEAGDERQAVVDLGSVSPHGGGDGWDARWITTPISLPVGYHRATVEVAGHAHHAMVLAPPPGLRPLANTPMWGVFAPTHAFAPDGRDEIDHLGIGHVGHLDDLARRVARYGARIVATLPLLATFLDEPFEPSPYAPVSRRWWSELHLDPAQLPGLSESPKATELIESRRITKAATELASGRHVDHRRAAALVNEVIDTVVADLADAGGPTADAVARFSADHPELEQYARFRALVERSGGEWAPTRSMHSTREIALSELDPAVVARHRYIQFAADRQMAVLATRLEARGQILALDLPLGASLDGFDVWANPDTFAAGMATGAPPDDFFSGGQNWGFPPTHPIRSRARGHEELVLAVRHHVRHSGLLRIDHLMSLERLWWIPDGCAAADGIYVRYPKDELMAIIAIETTRAGASVVGENLGTVTDEINETMERWQMLGMYELQFEAWRARDEGCLRAPSPFSVAGVNTHDMATFAGWWAGNDIVDSVDLGLVDPAEAPERLADRRSQIEAFAGVLARDLGRDVPVEPGVVLAAALEWLGRTPAQVVMVTLEDLWLEDQPQNVPGTHHERPNWRRRFSRTLDDAFSSESVVAVLEAIQKARTDASPKDST